MAINTGSGLNFVKRLYPPRIFGMAIGFPAVAAALYETGAPLSFWLLAAAYAFAWPHLAYQLSSHAPDPVKTEYRNLMFDAIMIGLWAPLMSFNLLPTLALTAMVCLANMSVGGWPFFSKGIFGIVAGAALGTLGVFFGWPEFTLHPQASLLIIAGTAPLLVAFPVSIGVINFNLSQRLLKQREELEKLSRTDDLTQLNNRRFWEDSVFSEFERYKRSRSPLSLVMIDIDHFKQVNDQFGHVAGDQMIREISDLLTANARQADVVGRYGGEEFAVLLPDTDAEGALLYAERIRLSVQTLNVKPYGISCTVSLGVAQASEDLERYRQLIEQADKALYDAKRQGRNLTVQYVEA
jgi:diguanylate cyclase